MKKEIAQGHYFIGIIVPENTSKQLRERSTARIARLLNSFSGDSTGTEETASTDTSKIKLNVFFDPITKKSFKTTISNSIERIISQIEMQGMVSALNEKMSETFPGCEACIHGKYAAGFCHGGICVLQQLHHHPECRTA